MKLTAHQLEIRTADKLLCSSFNLTVKPRETWGIIGPNGCGKTTLLHTLANLCPPTKGDIFLGEKNIRTIPAKVKAQQIGLLFQEMHFAFPQTVWDFCLTARYPHQGYLQRVTPFDRDKVRIALTDMALLTCKDRAVTKLSGGEKRRLAIASVLVQSPDIYLLDEPTNHLDIKHQASVLKHFQHLGLSQEKMIIMSLHDINLVQQFCTHAVLMFADGTHLQGDCQTVLTENSLSKLYQCTVRKIIHDEQVFWHF